MGYKFLSTLDRPEGTGTWTYLDISADVTVALGSKGQIKVKGTVDGEPFRSTLMPDGEGGHYLVVKKAIRDKIGKQAGDGVEVTLEPDDGPRELIIPDDFQSALSLDERASAAFEQMPHSHKKRYLDYINEAKTIDTRMRRIDKAVGMISQGQKLK